MSRRSAVVLRLACVAAAAIGYDLLSYYGTTHPAQANLGATLSLLPPLLVIIGVAWKSPLRGAAIAAAAACAGLAWYAWPLLKSHFPVLFLLQQAALWGGLLLLFAASLLPGRTPLCSQLAAIVHGTLSQSEQRYTRRVTQAWCLFFAAMGLTGAALYFLAPAHVWSAFNNLWTLPLVAAMFLLEYAVRLLALPQTAHVGLFEAVRLYSESRR
jgi:uncharacterized membrane protein